MVYRKLRIVLVFFLFLTVMLAAIVFYYHGHIPLLRHVERRIVIVDGLSEDVPNASLINRVSSLLSKFFALSKIDGEELTVNTYREIFMEHYDIYILRVHGGVSEGGDVVALFTSEPFNESKYVEERREGLVGVGEPFINPGKKLFVVSPDFIRRYGSGLRGSIVMVFSCYSSYRNKLAKAFIDAGAKAYIGWNGPVDTVTNDIALSKLIKYLFVENLTIAQAIRETMKDIIMLVEKQGFTYPTPLPLLTYYPPNVGDHTIWDLIRN